MTLSAEQLREPEIDPQNKNRVAIPDAGAQYGLDIEQQVKRHGYDAVRLPFDTPIETLYTFGAIILSGGPQSVYDPAAPKTDPRLFTVKADRPPVFGICYGQQLINYAMGGQVEKLDRREDGYTMVRLLGHSAVVSQLDEQARFVMSHGDTITQLAPGFQAIAYSGELIAGIANDEERLYGVQFHPEVSPPDGPIILRNFLQNIAGLESDYEYSYETFIADAIKEVCQLVGDKHVIAYISGGVDSSALAKLLQLALSPEQLSLMLVDHGFMRDDEVASVMSMLAASGITAQVYDARADYRQATTLIDGQLTPPLDQATEPEIKRKIIGDQFIAVKQDMARRLGIDPDNHILAMGTLYTDLIESGSREVSGKAATIKTHHNDTEEVRRLRSEGRALEPWRFIQKDDVREVGKLLGLKKEIYMRQPFPGPGLAIRIICGDKPYITENSLTIEAQLTSYDQANITNHLLPIQSVGLQGDERTYAHLVGLSGAPDWAVLKALADEIPRAVHDVNRVAYIFGEPLTSRDQANAITPTHLTPEAKVQLLAADAIVNRKLQQHGLDRTISQVPVILLPLNFGQPGKRSIAIRTFNTINFKTGNAAIPGVDLPEPILLEIVDELLALPFVARVLYDLTSKPPATIEWE